MCALLLVFKTRHAMPEGIFFPIFQNTVDETEFFCHACI